MQTILPYATTITKSYEYCYSHEHENDIDQCIADRIGDLGPPRSMNEVLWRSLGIHVIAVTAYGHLLSNQRAFANLSTWRCSILLISFLFFPLIPAVELVYRGIKVFSNVMDSASLRYTFAAWLGTNAVSADQTFPLHATQPHKLRVEAQSRVSVLIGRTLVLLLLLYQLLGSAAIFFRGYFVFRELESLYDIQDYRSLHMIAGATIATCNSLALVLLNSDWFHILPDTSIPHSFELEPQIQVNPISDNIQLGKETALSGLGGLIRVLARIAEKFETWLARRVPPSYQTNLDHALVLRVLFRALLESYPRHQNRQRWECQALSIPELCHSSIRRRLRQSLRFVLYPWPSKFSDAEEFYYRKMSPVEVLYYAVVARIVLVDLFRLYMRATPNSMQRINGRIMWVIGGRSIISFPLCIFGILLHAAVMVYNYAIATSVAQKQEQGLANFVKFKDPWYDNMYVL